ncbi:MAG: YggT family protein [Candidatus Marinimicrobia bacterium]|nr:YggT family protein [Candidatus Neomarinimicrobiota bacterium]
MNFILFTLINNIFNLLQMLIMIRVLLSWIPHDPYNQIIQILYRITEPILKPIRDILPMQSMGMDFSPIAAFFLLGFVKTFLLMAV